MNLSYPVFASKVKDNVVYVFFKEKDLKTTNNNLLKKNVFNDVTLIDSTGSIYRIKKAHKVKYIWLFGFSLLKKGRQILVDFEYEKDRSTLDLSEFKQYIIQKVEKNEGYWKTTWNIVELKENIMNSNSFKEIANLIK